MSAVDRAVAGVHLLAFAGRWDDVRRLVELAPNNGTRVDVLNSALEVIQGWPNPLLAAEGLGSLALSLPSDVVTAVGARLLDCLDGSGLDDESRFLAIRSLLPHLSFAQGEAALAAVRGLSPAWRAGALALLAPHADPDIRTALLAEARRLIDGVNVDAEAWVSLVSLADQLDDIDDATPVRALAIRAARSLHPGFRDHALRSIAQPMGVGPERESLLDEAILIVDELSEDYSKEVGLQLLAQLAFARGEHRRARELLEESLDLIGEGGPPDSYVEPLTLLADVARAEGDLDRARLILEQARGLSGPAPPLDVVRALGGLAADEGDLRAARASVSRIRRRARSSSWVSLRARRAMPRGHRRCTPRHC